MTERISALMDGELAGVAADSEALLLRKDGELREAWNTYHLIGDVMRGDHHPGYERRVAARLAEEPIVFNPRGLEGSRPWRYTRYALSAAASIAGVALVIWAAAPIRGVSDTELAQIKAQRVSPPQTAGTARGVENYLLAHQRYSPSNAMQGVAPYVRLVSEEREEAAR